MTVYQVACVTSLRLKLTVKGGLVAEWLGDWDYEFKVETITADWLLYD